MSNIDIVRAWKDENYCLGLSAAEQAELPANPAGMIELSDDALVGVDGGTTGWICTLLVTIQSVTVCIC